MIFIKILVQDLNINYIKVGTGKCNILLLPGWGTQIQTYMPIIDLLSSWATVYTLDMPGFGMSDEPKRSFNLDDYILFIKDFINKIGLKEFSIIGHSNGGRIIIKLLSENSNNDFKIDKAILIGSAGIVHKKTLKQKITITSSKIAKKFLNLKPIKKLFPNIENNLKKNFGSEDYKNSTPVMRETLVNLINTDLKDNLKNIITPTLLIWGTMDSATPIEDAYIMEKEIKDAGLVKIDGGTHFVFLENPTYVDKIIYTFLNGGN